jgi:hypothetical protein
MTTLEAKPMAFFFSPFSPLLGTPTPVAGASALGTAALSIVLLSLFTAICHSGRVGRYAQ